MFSGIKKLVLLGGGHAHLQVLSELAQRRPAELDITLVTPYPHQTYSGMVPGFVAGRYSAPQCQIPLEPLLNAAKVPWVRARCVGLDAAAREIRLSSSSTEHLRYDLLSIDTGSVLDNAWLDAHIPGASSHALRTRPMEQFVVLWPRVVELEETRPLSVAIIGAGAAGIELAFAAQQRLSRSRVTLITGGPEPGANYPDRVQERVKTQLRRRNITVLRERCTAVAEGQVSLSNGATLACDVPLLALPGQAPGWLNPSGLQLSASGHVLVDAQQASISHPEVFAAGDVATRSDQEHPKSGVYAVRAGPILAHNLLSGARGQPRRVYQPPAKTLNLLSCGAGHAIASRGQWSAEGGWAWYWKDWIDRRFVRQFGGQS